MDGNKKSREVGRNLLGTWHEAIKKGDASLLNELHANAKSFNTQAKHLGKNVAEEGLDSNVTSALSYAFDSGMDTSESPKARKLWRTFIDTPIKTKKYNVDANAIYAGRRTNKYMTKK
jgi:hypothetical protein